MNYDLTSLLITISAASASFSAILGGIIGSKLLSINGDRDINSQKIDDLTEELILKVERRDRFEYRVNADDAISFITEKMREFYQGQNLEEVYSNADHPGIEYEILVPFWQKATKLKKRIYDSYLESPYLNEDQLPDDVKDYVQDDEFLNDIAKEIIRYMLSLAQQRDKFASYGISMSYTAALRSLNHQWKIDLIEDSNKLSWEIEQLELKLKLLKQKKEALKRPRGITTGLWIFAAFSFVNIILPLLLCDFDISDIKTYRWIKYGSIGVFALGLIATLGYLIYMLKWNPVEKYKSTTKKGC
jgi:hypothetical protein